MKGLNHGILSAGTLLFLQVLDCLFFSKFSFGEELLMKSFFKDRMVLPLLSMEF